MPSKKKAPKTASPPTSLKGWQQISAFLGQRVNVAQRWAKSGMPIVRDGRSITATPADLNSWLAREAGGEPLHVSTERDDLSCRFETRIGLSENSEKEKSEELTQSGDLPIDCFPLPMETKRPPQPPISKPVNR